MTVEEKWFACRDMWDIINKFLPSRMREKDGERKMRLFACGCCRRQWQHIEGTPADKAIEVAELFADGLASLAELNAARETADAAEAAHHIPFDDGEVITRYAARYTAMACMYAAMDPTTSTYHDAAQGAALFTAQVAAYVKRGFYRQQDPVWDKYIAQENAEQTKLFRDIFGNPFRPVTFDPEWRTSTVMQLARGIYDNRNFGDLPILADALQDVGCNCDDILNHFRDPNAAHVRGCWALDLVLEKA